MYYNMLAVLRARVCFTTHKRRSVSDRRYKNSARVNMRLNRFTYLRIRTDAEGKQNEILLFHTVYVNANVQ